MSTSVLRVAGKLIEWEAERSGVKRPIARAIVAADAKIAPGALDRLERGTLKFVDRIAGHLNALFITKIKQRIAELETELAIHMAAPGRISETDALAAAAAVEEAKRLVRQGG